MAPRLSPFKDVLRAATRPSQAGLRRSLVRLPAESPLDEETLPHYDPQQFYPVRIGDVFDERYQVSGKLGYGAYSTSWLCRDMKSQRYVVLKVSTSLQNSPTTTDRESRIYEHLAKTNSVHPGQALLRELYNSFELRGHAGNHRCLILQPMHMTLLEMMRLNPKPFDLPLLKMMLRRLLLALDYLHTEMNITHTDLKTDNVLLSLEDTTMLADFADEEIKQPSPRKNIDRSRTIYQSRKFRRPLPGKSFGLPILCDFGEARIGQMHESGPFVQPDIYRAPEVIFEMPWGSVVDIWNLGALIWDLLEGRHLFGDIFDDNRNHDPFKHLALIVALIGPPPADFVQRSETTRQCFDHNGNWIANEEAPVPQVSLESQEMRLLGREQGSFLEFIRSMLQWLPEERRTAKQLLDDSWLL